VENRIKDTAFISRRCELITQVKNKDVRIFL